MTNANQDYTISFTVDRSPAEAFAAIVNPRAWWSEDIKGQADKVGEVFQHTYGDIHRCSLEVTALVPDTTVTWHVVENHFSFTADPAEWTGTDLVFTVTRTAKGTRVTFTHVGLAPALECYGDCSSAWNGAIGRSLQQLIAAGDVDANAA